MRQDKQQDWKKPLKKPSGKTEDWKEKIKQEIMRSVDLKSTFKVITNGVDTWEIQDYVRMKIMEAISKTEQHLLGTLVKPGLEMVFPSIICGKTHKPKIAKVSDDNLICLNCEYDFAMQETAIAIFDELEKNTGDRSEHSMVIISTEDYDKIKKKWVDKN